MGFTQPNARRALRATFKIFAAAVAVFLAAGIFSGAARAATDTMAVIDPTAPPSEKAASNSDPLKSTKAPPESGSLKSAKTVMKEPGPAKAKLDSVKRIYRAWEFGVTGWAEEIQISDGLGQKVNANVQFYTPSLNYTYRENRGDTGVLYEVYLMDGKGDVQSESSSLRYFQKRVSMYGVGGAAGWYYRPEGKFVNVGVAIPLQYRHASWVSPAPGVSPNKADLFAVGAAIDLRWRLTETFAFNQRIGGFLGYKSALWMMNVEWTLR